MEKPSSTDPILPNPAYNYGNGVNNDLITLGRVLFYDKNLSQDNSVSCGSCHQQAYGFADNKSFSNGFGGLQTSRNAHALINTNDSKFWDGKVNGCGGYSGQSSSLISVPLHSSVELNITNDTAICRKLSGLSYYPYLFNKAFNSPSVTLSQLEFAIASYIETINASNSRFDQANPSSFSSMFTQQEMDGMNVFNGKGGCANCHIAANNFSGNANQFEDIGLDATYKDLGRGAVTGNSGDNGRFHVPSLKNIALTAPYMHDGRFATLSQVVDFFSNGIHASPNLSSAFTARPYQFGNGSYTTGGTPVPLGLSDYEKGALVAFLQTLTDNSLVTDVRYSNPFSHP